MSSICLKSVFLLERRHRPTFETDFQIRCGSCYEFPSYKTSARWEVLVDMKLACWFCAVRSDSKVEKEEETFVILMADHNISYSCGDTLMKLIKGSFHRQKTCQDHKQMSNKIQCLKQGNAIFSVLLCGLSFLHQLCSFTPLLNPPVFFFVLSFSWWAQYQMEWNMVNLGLPSWQCPLSLSCHSHFWGTEKRQNFDSQGGKWNLLDSPSALPPMLIQKASSWRWQEAGKAHCLSSAPKLSIGISTVVCCS